MSKALTGRCDCGVCQYLICVGVDDWRNWTDLNAEEREQAVAWAKAQNVSANNDELLPEAPRWICEPRKPLIGECGCRVYILTGMGWCPECGTGLLSGGATRPPATD